MFRKYLSLLENLGANSFIDHKLTFQKTSSIDISTTWKTTSSFFPNFNKRLYYFSVTEFVDVVGILNANLSDIKRCSEK